jgi:hypothetical protein
MRDLFAVGSYSVAVAEYFDLVGAWPRAIASSS